MKHSIFLFVFLLFLQFVFAQTEVEEKLTKEHDVFLIVEVMPSWKGCEKFKDSDERYNCTRSGIEEFLTKNIIYPGTSLKKGSTETVYIQFIIDLEGKIIEPKVIRGVTPDFDEEALRVVALLPEMNPGIQRGKPVFVQYILPVKFTKEKLY
jgi:periplasmic protein TonB